MEMRYCWLIMFCILADFMATHVNFGEGYWSIHSDCVSVYFSFQSYQFLLIFAALLYGLSTLGIAVSLWRYVISSPSLVIFSKVSFIWYYYSCSRFLLHSICLIDLFNPFIFNLSIMLYPKCFFWRPHIAGDMFLNHSANL